MNYRDSFLMKFFSIITVLCYGYVNDVFADSPYRPGTGTMDEDIDIDGGGDSGGTSVPIIPINPTHTLCPAGQYVYKCGNYRVGFKWLKGMYYTDDSITTENDCDGDWNTDQSKCTRRTKNYYYITETDNNLSDDDRSALLQQMRDFFAAKNNVSIQYCVLDSDNNCTGSANAPIAANEYIIERDKILETVCNPTNTTITCAYCPDSANIPASTVKINAVTKKTSDWSFHTIADCYMNSFTDSTGTFKYVTNTSSQAKKCYYTNTNPEAFSALSGDSIEQFVSGITVNAAVMTIDLPSTGIRILSPFLQ